MTDAQGRPSQVPDWTRLPLDAGGRSLIEASAGTGKTWTIAVLYLRLLLEEAAPGAPPWTPRRIVVTTFTDAAAQELRARIRGKLRWAEQVAGDAVRNADFTLAADAKPDITWLVGRWYVDRGRIDPDRAARDRQRLRLALAELDMAPITTLHGLCSRILRDYPFESGSPFAAGELVAGDSVIDELAADLWRCLQQGPDAPPDRKSTGSLAALKSCLVPCLRPGVGLWAPDDADLARCLPSAWADRIAALAGRKDIWGAGKNAPESLRALACLLRDPTAPWTSKRTDHLVKATAGIGHDPELREEHEFLAIACRVLAYRDAAPEIGTLGAWTRKIREWRDARLAASGRLTFDELIQRVHDALVGDSRELADRLFAEWPVALVDEFQDTDAQQYAILDRIYRDADAAARGRLVMIGDPKQAIYRFRGGDIDTYLAASRDADAVLQIDTNYRSSRAYVAAVNEWFARAGDGLGTDAEPRIRYAAVKPSDRCDDQPYGAPDDEAAQPLVLHYRPEVPAAAAERRRLALTACANQIAAMLDGGRHSIAGRPVAPGDIAVLLPGHANVLELRALLQQRRVPCVGAGNSSVFDTDWARELQVVLYAIEHPADAGAVGAALATRLGGLDFERLRELRDAPDAWQVHAQRFAELKRRWHGEGVLAVVLELARDAMQRVPEAFDRERALTDLRHLGELLQEQEEKLQGAGQLLAWLAEQRDSVGGDSDDATEERQLRIESDAKRVRLMTLHASKGLEFPIVFLPLMWDHKQHHRDTTPVIHESLCGRRIVGFGAAATEQYRREGQDERFRILYVALTRAIHACHVYVLSPDRPATAARNSKPLADPARSALDAMVARLFATDAGTAGLQHVHWRESAWDWPDCTYRAAPASVLPKPVVLEEPARAPYENRWSFSALTRSGRDGLFEEEPADHEESVLPTDDAEAIDAIGAAAATVAEPALLELAGLRGAEFGNALHAVFETRRIGVPLVEQRELVAHSLRTAGVRLGDLPIAVAAARVAARLDAALEAELAPGLRLGAVPAERQRAEMEFHFTLDEVSIRRLRDACARHGDANLVPSGIRASILRGLMTGKIDLVFEHDGRFHVLDYKSNDLGRGIDHGLDPYRQDALAAAMDEHHYRFQALLYTVAVERYLRQRIPDYERARHLGDAIYLFARAAGLAPDVGIWRHRFDDALLEAVDTALAGESFAEHAA